MASSVTVFQAFQSIYHHIQFEYLFIIYYINYRISLIDLFFANFKSKSWCILVPVCQTPLQPDNKNTWGIMVQYNKQKYFTMSPSAPVKTPFPVQ